MGACNPVMDACHSNRGRPVNTATGNFWHTFSALAIPGRGIPLGFEWTYNSMQANQAGPMGYGWSHNYNMLIDTATISGTQKYQVHQENGSLARFYVSNLQTDPNTLATLDAIPPNNYVIFTHKRGQDHYYFNPLNGSDPGKLYAVADRNGWTTNLDYDPTTHMVSHVTDSAGRQLTLSYTITNTAPYLTSISDSIGRSVGFGYDNSGNLNVYTDVVGLVTRFTYDANHQLLTMTDPNGGIVTNTYESSGPPTNRVVTQIDPESRRMDFEYHPDGENMTTWVTDTLGYTTVYTYNQNRLFDRTENPTDPQPHTWHYAYDSVYHTGVISTTDPNGHTWNNTWDANGNMLSSTDPLSRTTLYAYTARNDLAVMTNSVSIPITYNRDAAGNVLRIYRPLTQTNQIALTSFGYDPARPGDVLTVTNPLGKSWAYAHDPNYGYVLTTTNPLNESDKATYDAAGRMLRSTNPIGFTTTYTYTTFSAPSIITDAYGYTTTYTYDGNRNLKTLTDANGHTTTYSYNRDDERTRVTRPDVSHSDYGYDGNGNVISQTNALGNPTRYAYDRFDRLASVTDPLTRTTSYGYDLAGNRTIMTDAIGLATRNSYDAADQLRNITYNSATTPDVAFNYSPLGLRTVMTDGTGISAYAYDSLNRLTSASNGAGQMGGYGYDLADNQTSITYPNTSGYSTGTVSRTYNDANRLIKVTDWLNKSTDFQYDRNGNISRINYPGGVESDLYYTRRDELRTIVDTSPLTSTAFLDLDYHRDGVGLIYDDTEMNTSRQFYSYDSRNRLVSDLHYTYTPTNTTVSSTWGYDGATEITQTAYLPLVSTGTPITRTLSYDKANQLAKYVEQQGTQITKYLLYSRDNNGNRTYQNPIGGLGQVLKYVYDQEDRLITLNPGQPSATYAYNGDGLRMSKNTCGNPCVASNFTWDPSSSIPLLLRDRQASYIYGPGGMLLEQVNASGTPYFYHADHQGSIRAMTDKNGNVVNTYKYDPYGNRTASTGSVYNPFGFTGEYTDMEAGEFGFIYLRARYYDPVTEQFFTRDPSGDVEEPYAYVGGSPPNSRDPMGLRPMDPGVPRRSHIPGPVPTRQPPISTPRRGVDPPTGIGKWWNETCKSIRERWENAQVEAAASLFAGRLTEEVIGRLSGPNYQTEYWRLEDLSSSHKVANLDPSLGPNQVRYQARFVDDATNKPYDISVNYDPDTGLFGIIKEASGR